MKTAPWIIIIILIVLLLLQRECTPDHDCPPCPPCLLQHCDTTKDDTVFYNYTVYVPNYIYSDTGSTLWKYHEVDTTLILSDYFAKRYYSDTLINDTNLFVSVSDTVWQNKIISRLPVINFIPTIVTKTNTVTLAAKPVHKIFAGISVGRSVEQFGLSANVMYISKRDNAYSMSYDILNKDIYFTMYWKLSFRKNGR